MNLDLSNVIGAFANPSPFTVERFSAAGYDNSGRALSSEKSTFTISAVKKPANGKDVVLSVDGQRTIETFVILTTTELRTSDNRDGTPADRILIDGRPFEITSGKVYGNLGNYCRYIAVLLPGDAPPVGGPSAGATFFARAVTVEPVPELVATNVQDALAELQAVVSTKVTQDALDELASELDDLAGVVALKASAADLSDLLVRVDAIESSLGDKASVSDLAFHANSTNTHGVAGNVVGTQGAQTLADKTHTSTVVDDASAIAHVFDTTNALSNVGAKLVSWRNSGVEKWFVDRNGSMNIRGVLSGANAIVIPSGSRVLLDGASGGRALSVTNGFVNVSAYFEAELIRVGRGIGEASAITIQDNNGVNTTEIRNSDGLISRFVADTTLSPGNATANVTSHGLVTKTSIGRSAVAAGATSVTITTATARSSQLVMITPRQVDPNVKTFGALVYDGYFVLTLDAAPSAPWSFNWELKETK